MSHQQPAANVHAPGHRRAVGTIVGFCVTFLSVVLTSLAPGLVSNGPVSAAVDTGAFVAAGPHRLADTRSAPCGCRRIDEFTIRVQIAGLYGIPGVITAAAITVTATNVAADGVVSVYPAGTPAPLTSTLNPRVGVDLANSAIVSVGGRGAIEVRSTLAIGTAVELIVDVTGVFVPDDRSREGRFRTLASARIWDSRVPGAPATGLEPGTSISLPLPRGVASDATAIAINVTTIGGQSAGFLSVRPAGAASTSTSFMNPDGSGRPLASSVIAPVSSRGLVITTTAAGHIIVDVVGWFTGPSAVASGNGLFVATAPNRIVDSRADKSRLWPNGTREVDLDLDATAIATNVTIDRTDGSGFVTSYAAGTRLPAVSTINALDVDDTIANFAITPISNRGIAYFSDRGTDLIVDVTGYFTGTPTKATFPPPPNVQPPARALLIGDSTLAGVRWYRTTEALLGFPYEYSAESCRRLATASCRGREGFAPKNAVNAIRSASGSFGTVVMMAGYDDWWTVFPSGFDQVVAAAREKGARTIVWLTFREGVRYHGASETFVKNNETMREKIASGLFPDVVLADWNSYTATTSGWLAGDGVHLSRAGSYAVADYISRKLAFLENRACPMPWVVGEAVDLVCPDPDTQSPVADITDIYN